MKKYTLTKTSIEWAGRTLFQIKANISFGIVKKGELGGYIEKEDNLSLEGDAWVFGDAQVYGNAWVSGNAWVYGDAQVYGSAWVYGDARVYGNARVFGDAWVYGDAQVYGSAWVYGDAWVFGDARVSGNARVFGDAWVSAKKAFTKGWFIGGDDTEKITNITDQTGTDYWKSQYVLGDYEIKDLEETEKVEVKSKLKTIILDGEEYELLPISTKGDVK